MHKTTPQKELINKILELKEKLKVNKASKQCLKKLNVLETELRRKRRFFTKLASSLYQLRVDLDPVFSLETAAGNKEGLTPSTEHCAAVSVIINNKFGGEFVSTKINGESHWFNIITFEDKDGEEDKSFYVDLTGDQFGFPEVQMLQILNKDDTLYKNSELPKIRKISEINKDTLKRAAALEHKLNEHLKDKYFI